MSDRERPPSDEECDDHERKKEKEDDVLERLQWFQRSRTGGSRQPPPPDLIARASLQRNTAERTQLGVTDAGATDSSDGPVPSTAPPPPDGGGGPGGALPTLAPGIVGSVNWTPLGPSAAAHGQATGGPRVSGRVTSLAVGPA